MNFAALEFLLKQLEAEARRTLKDDLPFGLTAELDLSDLWSLTEHPDEYQISEKVIVK
jgi:hypothetical protein